MINQMQVINWGKSVSGSPRANSKACAVRKTLMYLDNSKQGQYHGWRGRKAGDKVGIVASSFTDPSISHSPSENPLRICHVLGYEKH